MKLFLFVLLFSAASVKNVPINRLDTRRYSGTWYSLYSIPTRWDKGSRETTGTYTWNKKGYFDVVTTCLTEDGERKSVNSKVMLGETAASGRLKAQFIWPFKIDYWVIELADDYSYVVVGHPEQKFLFIMSRKKHMDPEQYKAIVERCKERGYLVAKLTSQLHSSD